MNQNQIQRSVDTETARQDRILYLYFTDWLLSHWRPVDMELLWSKLVCLSQERSSGCFRLSQYAGGTVGGGVGHSRSVLGWWSHGDVV